MPRRLVPLLLAVSTTTSACTCRRLETKPPLESPPVLVPSPTPIDTAAHPGLVIEHVRASLDPPVAVGDRQLTLVRIDPARYAFRLLTAAEHGKRRTAPAWAREFGMIGIINASMYRPDGRSVGFMVDGDAVNNPNDDARYGGLLVFGPVDPRAPPVAFLGRDCEGFELGRMRRDYRTVVANYRLLDCSGAAIAWKDEKAYSAAAIGLDRSGWVVFVHARTPYPMRAMSTMLAAPELRMAAALYVEGGPEASLYVDAGPDQVRAIGSYETGFQEDDANAGFWEIPNVIGFAPR